MLSLAGHDRDRLYIVLETDGEFLYLTDGRHHKLKNPKKKKLKHLRDTGYLADLSVYDPLYDAHIVKELKSLLKKGGCYLG